MKTVEKQLLKIYRDLADVDQQALLKFAAYLKASQKIELPVDFDDKVISETYKGETVVGALKRLSGDYPMLDQPEILDQAANLMSDHVLRGRAEDDVISELGMLFDRYYQELKREHKPND